MADSTPHPKPGRLASPPEPRPAAAATAGAVAATALADKPPPAPAGNPALRMLGLPNLPRKLPSRNWLIFWAVTGAFASALIYDRREKRRATARWRRAVEPLSRELVASPNQLPRKLTVYLEAPPGDGLRVAQDHFIEYVKPVLAGSGLDWEFVQGRQQGDVRAAVAEKVRRARMPDERPGVEQPKTDDALVEDLRKKMGVPQYEGVKGDIVVGRHAWKEYVRGLHEGWLGPLDPPPPPPQPEAVVEADAPMTEAPTAEATTDKEEGDKKEDKPEQKKDEKPARPPQPPPHNTPDDYASASVPACIPHEFSPSAPIPFPHRLGFSQTFVRLARFFNRRALADDIGREVAAVCLAAGREWREADGLHEQQLALAHEESDWPSRIWKDKDDDDDDDDQQAAAAKPPKERIWTSPMVLDGRIAQRMRRFEMAPEDAARAASIVVPEDEVEGWVKGSLRSLWRWGASAFDSKPTGPNVGSLDDD